MTKPHAVVSESGVLPPDQTGTATPPPSDPFDLANLRLDQSFIETAGVKKLLRTVPTRKPSPQDFVRVHPGSDYRENLALIELKEDREVYLVTPAIASELPGEFQMYTIFTAINRQGVVFLGRSGCQDPMGGCSSGTEAPPTPPSWPRDGGCA